MPKKNISIVFEKDIVIFLGIFIYALLTGLAIQLLILPYIFPAWHAGDGLLAGLDSVRFHKAAVILAEQMKTQGWSVWQLRPEGQAPAGIAAIFYRYILPCPCVLLPFNALLHALAGISLFKIMQQILSTRMQALLSIIPFVIYPSAMTWLSQIHKDSLFIAGIYLYLYGWLKITNFQGKRKAIFQGVGLSLSGLLFVWIVRDYAVEMMTVASIPLLMIASFTVIKKQKKRSGMIHFSPLLGLFSIILAGFMLSKIDLPVSVSAAKSTLPSVSIETPKINKSFEWQPSILPASIDGRLHAFAAKREAFRLNYPNAGSNIDVQISLNSPTKIIQYIPRALQIGLLAPFPADWFGEGTLEQNTLQRRISGFEMTIAYVGLFFLPFGIYRWRHKQILWHLLTFCLIMILLYALIVANVGTLYRFRYAFYTPLIGLGLASFLQIISPKAK